MMSVIQGRSKDANGLSSTTKLNSQWILNRHMLVESQAWKESKKSERGVLLESTSNAAF